MKKYQKLLESINPFLAQEKFFLANKKRIAYGGARGGGKSYAMRTKLVLLALNYPGIQILILRKTFAELRENHINPLRRSLKNIAEYKETTKEFVFPNKSRIKLGYLDTESDILQYQGQSYEVIGMEEATLFTETQYYAMTECCRMHGLLNVPFVPRMYFTCNPGGVGHNWVKRLFIDRDYKENENPDDYIFIPSTVYDNKYIMQENPDYVKSLESLPEQRKKAMLYGDWDAFEGQYFTEFDREKHVVTPFSIPDDWIKFAALDYGLDMTACLWFGYPRDRSRLVIYKELYREGLILSEAAKKICELNGDDKIRYVVASPDLGGRRQDSGKTGFDIMKLNGIKDIIPANNERIIGWRRIREFLNAENPDGTKYLNIFPQCKNIIRTLPKLIFDPKVSEDVSDTPHELTHAPDAMRYGIMDLPFLPGQIKEETVTVKSIEKAFFGKENRNNSYIDFMKK